MSACAEVRLAGDLRHIEIRAADNRFGALVQMLRLAYPELRLRARRGFVETSLADAGAMLDDARLYWDVSAELAVRNRREVRARADAVLMGAKELLDAGTSAQRAALGGRPITEVLDPHQIANVALMTIPGGWGNCVFDEQGTGKTPTVIAAFDVLVDRNETDVLIIVAPKSMLGEWGAEFRRFTGGLYRVAVVQGGRHERSRALASGADVIVVNYEGAVSMSADLQLLARRSRCTLVVDESFNVKNPDASRTAAVASLREHCGRCFVLCGTPAPNTARDIVAQVDLVDFGLTFDEADLELLEGEDERTAIRSALSARGMFSRNLKAAVLPGLPSRRFDEIRVPFAPRQGRLYGDAAEGLALELANIGDEEFERRRLEFGERRSALLRLCSHPGAVVSGYDETPTKFSALDELLGHRIGREEKVVLWSFFRYTLDALAARYAHHGLVRIDGSVTGVEQRRDAVRRFQEDDETMVFLGNPAAAGAGLTLHRAAVAIYESFSNQAAHFMQSLDRIHRRGQTCEVEYVVLMCEGSVETLEYERILGKVDRQAELLGDPSQPRSTRTLMLEELRGTLPLPG